jgi:hypothetical protein
MRIPGIHEPDPNHPEGMAWVFAAGVCDPRPGGYPKKIHPNQQWALKQSWEPTSKMFWDLGLRWHPELATKWLAGGGQFSIAEIVDKPPDEPTFEELANEMAQEQFAAMKAEIDNIMENGTPYQKERLRQRFRAAATQSAQIAEMLESQIKDLPDEKNLDKEGGED